MSPVEGEILTILLLPICIVKQLFLFISASAMLDDAKSLGLIVTISSASSARISAESDFRADNCSLIEDIIVSARLELSHTINNRSSLETISVLGNIEHPCCSINNGGNTCSAMIFFNSLRERPFAGMGNEVHVVVIPYKYSR